MFYLWLIDDFGNECCFAECGSCKEAREIWSVVASHGASTLCGFEVRRAGTALFDGVAIKGAVVYAGSYVTDEC